MSGLADLAQQIARLDPPDREQLFSLLTPVTTDEAASTAQRLTTPAIVTTPGVCGGAARIIRTRIPVWTLFHMKQLGVSEADILRSYPSLRAVDLVQAWAFSETHLAEIERQIRENEEE